MSVSPGIRVRYPKLKSGADIKYESPVSIGKFLGFALFNIILAYLSRQSYLFSTLFGWFTLLLGLFFLLRDDKPTRIIYLCGYIVGAELIWRSTRSGVFYEYGKYAVVFLLGLALLKYRLLRKAPKWPIIYFVLLLPSITLLPFFDRETISFFLSGPLLLAVSTMFFSTIRMPQVQLEKLLVAIIAPTIALAFLATYSTLTAAEIIFNTESNFTTAGGFGPVQISLQLAFGALLAFYFTLIAKGNRVLTVILYGTAIWLISQSIFTFSRSGLYNSVATLLVFLLFNLRKGGKPLRIILLVAVLLLLVAQVAFPWMDQFSGSMLSLRYQDTISSARITLIKADWQAFLDNPYFGVGPGQSLRYHDIFGIRTSSHTEFSRLLSEHGLLGLFSLFIMAVEVIKRITNKIPIATKSFQMLMTAWALFYMLNTTMRTASPGFMFGLGAAVFIFDQFRAIDETQNPSGGQLSFIR